MKTVVESRRGSGRTRPLCAARRVSLGTILLSAVLLSAVLLSAVTAAPAPAQVSGGDPPDYVLEEDGTVVIDGDGATDCRSFAAFLEEGYFDLGNPAQAQSVLDQCEEAGLLPPDITATSASPGAAASDSADGSASPGAEAADGEGGQLPDTGGPALPALLVALVLLTLLGVPGLTGHLRALAARYRPF